WASHQWIDCNQGNTPISGATTRNYTPNYTGDYACIVTKGNCSDTTDCVNVIRNTSGIAEVNKATASIFPNPANDNIKITSNSKIVSVEIMDVTGKVVLVNTSNDSNINITTVPSGAYIARISTVNGIVNSKFIKE
ncbi:MAG: T9SS type A sorting domain-containing protein, partial [Flavobacteriales bacterium]|nr:T9SS type A sorting domain-containing protein [Flavobacteriales bacterium]